MSNSLLVTTKTGSLIDTKIDIEDGELVAMSKYSVGDIVIFNKFKKFGDENDKLFHIHALRYGNCTGVEKKQYWYAGYLLEIKKHKSIGLPQIPIFATTITNVAMDEIKSLDLGIEFDPY